MKQKEIIFILDRDANTVKKIVKDSPKLNWDNPHTPERMVQFTPRSNSTNWFYAYYGTTKEECLTAANARYLMEIDKLQGHINALMAKLLTTETCKEQSGVIK